jgi:hypothetical protein
LRRAASFLGRGLRSLMLAVCGFDLEGKKALHVGLLRLLRWRKQMAMIKF